MGKVIFKKNDKIITIPMFIYERKSKIKGLYEKVDDRVGSIIFNEEVSEVKFDNCKFYRPLYFDLLSNQRLVLNECNSYVSLVPSINISGGFFDIHNCNFDYGSLYIKDCVSVLLDSCNTIGDYKFGGISIEASNVLITGNFDLCYNSISINSNNLDISNANIFAQTFEIVSSNINIEDSNLGYYGYCSCDYDNIVMNNVKFVSENGKLVFTIPLSGKEKTKYSRVGSLTNSDIFNDKNNNVYSLISILKGYSNCINEINKKDIENRISEIKSKHNDDIDMINELLEQLTVEKNKMLEIIDCKSDLATYDLSNRKVKQITYPKK